MDCSLIFLSFFSFDFFSEWVLLLGPIGGSSGNFGQVFFFLKHKIISFHIFFHKLIFPLLASSFPFVPQMYGRLFGWLAFILGVVRLNGGLSRPSSSSLYLVFLSQLLEFCWFFCEVFVYSSYPLESCCSPESSPCMFSTVSASPCPRQVVGFILVFTFVMSCWSFIVHYCFVNQKKRSKQKPL